MTPAEEHKLCEMIAEGITKTAEALTAIIKRIERLEKLAGVKKP